jgi:hypothetical protein
MTPDRRFPVRRHPSLSSMAFLAAALTLAAPAARGGEVDVFREGWRTSRSLLERAREEEDPRQREVFALEGRRHLGDLLRDLRAARERGRTSCAAFEEEGTLQYSRENCAQWLARDELEVLVGEVLEGAARCLPAKDPLRRPLLEEARADLAAFHEARGDARYGGDRVWVRAWLLLRRVHVALGEGEETLDLLSSLVDGGDVPVPPEVYAAWPEVVRHEIEARRRRTAIEARLIAAAAARQEGDLLAARTLLAGVRRWPEAGGTPLGRVALLAHGELPALTGEAEAGAEEVYALLGRRDARPLWERSAGLLPGAVREARRQLGAAPRGEDPLAPLLEGAHRIAADPLRHEFRRLVHGGSSFTPSEEGLRAAEAYLALPSEHEVECVDPVTGRRWRERRPVRVHANALAQAGRCLIQHWRADRAHHAASAARAEEVLLRAVQAAKDLGDQGSRFFALACLGDLLNEQGRYEECLAALSDLGDAWGRGLRDLTRARRMQVQALLALGREGEGEACFAHIARPAKADGEYARAAYDLGMHFRDRVEASWLLEEAAAAAWEPEALRDTFGLASTEALYRLFDERSLDGRALFAGGPRPTPLASETLAVCAERSGRYLYEWFLADPGQAEWPLPTYDYVAAATLEGGLIAASAHVTSTALARRPRPPFAISGAEVQEAYDDLERGYAACLVRLGCAGEAEGICRRLRQTAMVSAPDGSILVRGLSSEPPPAVVSSVTKAAAAVSEAEAGYGVTPWGGAEVRFRADPAGTLRLSFPYADDVPVLEVLCQAALLRLAEESGPARGARLAAAEAAMTRLREILGRSSERSYRWVAWHGLLPQQSLAGARLAQGLRLLELRGEREGWRAVAGALADLERALAVPAQGLDEVDRAALRARCRDLAVKGQE